MNDIKVTIWCATYNHVRYIRRCLEGFVNQITDFRYEIIIRDDASTDGTQDIIKEYIEKYPELFVPIFEEKNLFNTGINTHTTYLWPNARGKYIAYCEGDDYWTDMDKLQKQFDALENNQNLTMCVHTAQRISEDEKELLGIIPGKDYPTMQTGIISNDKYAKLIYEDGGYPFHTASYFIRREILHRLSEKEFNRFNKWDDNVLRIALLGNGIFYYNEIMSIYRINSVSSTVNIIKKSAKDKQYGIILQGCEFDIILCDELKGKYKNIIYRSIAERLLHSVDLVGSKQMLKDLKMMFNGRDYISYLSINQKIKLLGYRLCPNLFSKILKIKQSLRTK